MLLQYDVYNSTLKKQHSAIPSQQFNYQSKLTVKSLCHLQCIAPLSTKIWKVRGTCSGGSTMPHYFITNCPSISEYFPNPIEINTIFCEDREEMATVFALVFTTSAISHAFSPAVLSNCVVSFSGPVFA